MKVITICLFLLTTYLWVGCASKFTMEELSYLSGEKHKGVCWVGSPRPLEGGELKQLSVTGANFISQTPFGWQDNINEPEIRWEQHKDKTWWGEGKSGLEVTKDSALAYGIGSMLKPHLWARGSWPGEISMNSTDDWTIWFENYQDFILYYAEMAEKAKLPILCIGTELEKASGKTLAWRKIIKNIRKIYSGKLTYAANFTEYEQIEFWDELDFIGIQAYFPLTKEKNPDTRELKKAWSKILPEIESFIVRFEKPVLFTELGYCNTIDAAESPWVWPNERMQTPLSDEMQAKCYQAFFESVWDKPWFQGVYFWKWYPQPRGREPDFSPQNKLAEQVMKDFFTQVD